MVAMGCYGFMLLYVEVCYVGVACCYVVVVVVSVAVVVVVINSATPVC